MLVPVWAYSQYQSLNAAPATQESGPKENAPGYSILSDVNAAALVIKVNEAMQKGWEPAGGLAIHPSGPTFYQAMQKTALGREELRRRVVLPPKSDGK